MPRHSVEMHDVELVLGDAEISRRIDEIPAYSRRTEMVRFSGTGDDSGMTPKIFKAWVALAEAFGDGVTMDASAIYRLKTDTELRRDIVATEFNERTKYGQHYPAVSYEELVAAGYQPRADELAAEYGDQAYKSRQPQYVD